MNSHLRKTLLALFLLTLLALSACQPAPTAPDPDRLQVIASTTIIADVVQQVGGEHIQVTTLFPPGSDPHSYQPTPRDIASLSDASIIFLNGLELEASLENTIASTASDAVVVELSSTIQPRDLTPTEKTFAEGEPGGKDVHDSENDPHVWTDPNNIMVWVKLITATLTEADPSNAETYTANATAYSAQLAGLDTWVQEQVAQIPQENRKMLSNHLTWGYFAQRYGFEQIGAVIPSFSSMAEPSAQEIAALEEVIRQSGVKAIFVENTLSPRLAEQVAADTGVQIVALLTDSLDASLAPHYIDYIRYNVTTIVDALK